MNLRIELAGNVSSALVVGVSLLKISPTAGAHSEDETLERTSLPSNEDCPSSPLTPIEEEVAFYEEDLAKFERTTGDNLTSDAEQAHLSDALEGPSSPDQTLSNEESPFIDNIPNNMPTSSYSIPSESASVAQPRVGVMQLESEAVNARPARDVQGRIAPTRTHEMVRISIFRSKIKLNADMKFSSEDPRRSCDYLSLEGEADNIGGKAIEAVPGVWKISR